jgi:hypothetical protein
MSNRTNGHPNRTAYTQEENRIRKEDEATQRRREEDLAYCAAGCPEPETDDPGLYALSGEQERAQLWIERVQRADWSERPLHTFVWAIKLAAHSFRLSPGTEVRPFKSRRMTVQDYARQRLVALRTWEVSDSTGAPTPQWKCVGDTFTRWWTAEDVMSVHAARPAAKSEGKPTWVYGEGWLEPGRQLVNILRPHKRIMRQGGELVEFRGGGLVPIRPVDFAALIEDYVTPAVATAKGLVPTPLDERRSRATLTNEIIYSFPALTVVTQTPTLVLRADRTLGLVSSGLDEESGVYVDLPPGDVVEVPLDDAVAKLRFLAERPYFVAESDRARFLAALFMPALAAGGFLSGPRPITLLEAYEEQTGKGYFAKVLTQVYNTQPTFAAVKEGGVGAGLDEAICSAIASGRSTVILDNVRSTTPLKSAVLEAFVTCDQSAFPVRVLRRTVEVDPRRYSVFVTSNGAQMSRDIAERTFWVRLKKKPDNEPYELFDGVDLKQLVRQKWRVFLASVHTIIRDWWDNHRSRGGGVNRVPHSFAETVGIVDFIVRHYFGCVSVCDDLAEIKLRSVDPVASFIREMFGGLLRRERAAGGNKPERFLGVPFRIKQLLTLADSLAINIPGDSLSAPWQQRVRRLGSALAQGSGSEPADEDEESRPPFRRVATREEIEELEDHTPTAEGRPETPRETAAMRYEGFVLRQIEVKDAGYRRRRAYQFDVLEGGSAGDSPATGSADDTSVQAVSATDGA